jgi:uncharacterized membrane protein
MTLRGAPATLTAQATAMSNNHDQIDVLEAEIDQTHDAVEHCRKINVASKAALVGGCVTVVVGFVWHSPLALVIAIGAILGSLASPANTR